MPGSPESDPHNVLLVAPLAQFDRASLALAGGKGANLGELVRAGFRVPPGFVITTAAYDLLLQENNLLSLIRDSLAELDTADPDSVAKASREIRQALLNATVPSRVAGEALSAYQQMGGGPVAVRSSATAEDLPGAAFAGQQETFLNVLGERALLEAIHSCWASLWSERAALYRARQNVDQATVQLAVVVQQMVPASAAGVMFTANPVSGSRDELVIHANPGLGEAVVGGLVTPDQYVLDKRSLRLKEQHTGKREVIVRARPEGGTEQIRPGRDEAARLSLPAPALRQLARTGKRIERHYAAPQDIEWAWVSDEMKNGRIYILQARPMTALPDPIETSGPLRRVIPMLAEMWPERPYPLDMTTFTSAIERTIGDLLGSIVGKSAPHLEETYVEEEGVLVRFKPPEFHPSPGILFAPWLALWRTRHYEPARWQADPALAEFVRRSREIEKRDLYSLTWAQNIDTLHEALDLLPLAMEVREHYFPRMLVGFGILWLSLALARQRDRFGSLIGGLETKTTETNQALEALAAEIRSDPSLQEMFSNKGAGELLPTLQRSPAGPAFLERFQAFLERYGHRETSLTISDPAWKDRPEIVLGILKVLAESEPKKVVSTETWKAERDEILAHTILGTWPLRPLFLKALANARLLFQIREDTHFYATLLQPPMRRVALELGRRLQEAGALESAEDVFHLRLKELEPLGEPWPPASETLDRIRALAARRKARRAALSAQPLFDPRLLTVNSLEQGRENVLLTGVPGSPGRASGPARIVHDSSEFGKLQPGDVLVAPVTNPAWTPLFQRAAGIIVDTGGAASHAAIVAREYGVPAVMGTLKGTQQLKDGQWIQVDGSRGLVLGLPSNSEQRVKENDCD